jgi:hypothetical protein
VGYAAAAENPIGTLVPSSAQTGLNGGRAPVRTRLGGGAAQVHRVVPIAVCDGAAAAGHATRRARGEEPTGASAFADAGSPAFQRRIARRSPPGAREASGSSAALPAPRRHVGSATARCRGHLAETARAHVGAKPVKAVPWRCVFAKRARSCWPAGVARHKRPAAAAQAPGRSAFPSLGPAGPSRVPADALAH